MANDFGNIDRYFRGEMGVEEIQQFESIITQNPILEKEFSFQQELVEGIQAARKAELKAILNNIDVTTGVTVSKSGILTKILGSVAIAGIVVAGAYLYLGEDEVISQTEPVNTNPEVVKQETTKDIEDIPVVDTKDSTAVTIVEKDNIPQETTVTSEVTKTEGKTKTLIVINEANVQEGFDDEIEVSETEAPANHLISKSKVTHSTLEVAIEKSKRYSFHYQVKNNTLALYGDFSNLYEILEFHKDGNTTTYLKYDKKYYEINKQQSKAAPLVELTEDQLLKLLDSIENNKER